jgi:hypothetical protein
MFHLLISYAKALVPFRTQQSSWKSRLVITSGVGLGLILAGVIETDLHHRNHTQVSFAQKEPDLPITLSKTEEH